MNAADAIRSFNETTANRLPSLDEVYSLCDGCRIRIKVKDGEPIMSMPGACLERCGKCDYCRANATARHVSQVVAELIGREPWRRQVIERITQEQPCK